ncbi:hypothetical protein BpHYR1_005810 [Brachionus plicatilis]|uniref:Uncharacterized protein n=1 Tax=Brachionus plicatilis TaxID=10195 RepID=A0A3M7QDN1_BRAPC|nr:hypothetical protein BpHYR1_005810 [Brachionus plicatilis]
MIHMNCKDTDQMVDKMEVDTVEIEEASLALEKVLELEVALESALEVIDNIFALYIQVIFSIFLEELNFIKFIFQIVSFVNIYYNIQLNNCNFRAFRILTNDSMIKKASSTRTTLNASISSNDRCCGIKRA